MKKFEVVKLSKKINSSKNNLIEIYSKNGYKKEKEELINYFNEIDEEEKILITFIGQYSAGKSTIISALTGREDIKIDADISTEEVTQYNWFDQIKLVDTPGLHTENMEHDDLTREAILKSDILVYCITNELFDTITKEDYIDLVYDKDYKRKTFLVINKMSREFGEYERLKDNYINSINESINPYKIEDVNYSFIDAKDYLDGINSDIYELIELSHFEEFIQQLNNFVNKNKLIGKLNKPIDLLILSIDEILAKNLNDDREENTIKLMNRINKDLTRSKLKVKRRCYLTVEKRLMELRSYGNEIVHQIGEKDINEEELNAIILEKTIEIDEELENIQSTELQYLEEDIKNVFDSNMGKIFFDTIKGKLEINEINLSPMDINPSSSNILETLKFISSRSNIQKYSFPLGIKSSEVSQTFLHELVKLTGNKLGVKFKPWQAVDIAKNLGKFTTIFGAGLPLVESYIKENKENEYYKKVKSIKEEFRNELNNLISQIREDYIDIIESGLDWYDEVENKINNIKKSIIDKNEKIDNMTLILKSEREELLRIKSLINKE